MKQKEVAIVGSGASAMYAVLACNAVGIKPDVFSKDLVVTPGAFWLKYLPRNVREFFKEEEIAILSIGSREAYINKQWTSIPADYKSSFPSKNDKEVGYNPEIVLPYVFTLGDYCHLITLKESLADDDLGYLSDNYKFVFHSFPTQKAKEVYRDKIVKNLSIISLHDKSLLTIRSLQNTANWCMYDGDPTSVAVRQSALFGKFYIELSKYASPENVEFIVNNYPNSKISFFFDLAPGDYSAGCFPVKERIIPIGRPATFNRKELSSDTFSRVINILEGKDEHRTVVL